MRAFGRTAGAVVVVAALVGLLPACSRDREPAIIVGVPKPTTTLAPPPPTQPRPRVPAPDLGARSPRPEPGPAIGLVPANGQPFRPAIPFTTRYGIPDELLFILVIGSDARPGEDLETARADSIHVVAVNPYSQEGTVLGLPRDSWVEIPGARGKHKINDALTRGGPDLLAATVERLTGIDLDYYVLTGFAGLRRMVDTLDGVDVFVRRRMNDKASGARFEPGWHRFNGNEALAYARNRKDVEYGDFSRSQHQGEIIVAALAKMRAEVADDDGVARWISILLRDVRLDIPADDLPLLGAFARRLRPERIVNVVAPGRVGSAGGQSVVFLGEEAQRMFADIRVDAVFGEPAAPPPSTTTTTTVGDGALDGVEGDGDGEDGDADDGDADGGAEETPSSVVTTPTTEAS